MRLTLASALLLAMFLPAAARAEERALGLRLDYLSPIVRDGEEVRLSLRVENRAPRAARATVRVERTDASGRVAERRDFPLDIPAGGYALASYAFRARGRLGELRWRFVGAEAPAGRARFLEEAGEWPDLAPEGFGLADKEETRFVLRLRKRKAERDAYWAWPRALARQFKRAPGGALLFVPRYAGDAWIDQLREAAPHASVCVRPVAPEGTVPALHCLASLERALAARAEGAAGAVLVVLPAEDALRGTDPRLLGAAVEWMLARARRVGAHRCVVAGPFTPGAPLAPRESLREAACEAARLFDAGALALEELEGDRYWRPEGGSGRVLAREPNAEGRARLAEILAAAVK